jgi:fructokinase
VRFLGRISDDEHGQVLRSLLERDGVGTDLLVMTTEPTTTVRATIDADGVARYEFALASTSAPGLNVADARAALEAPPRALHVGTLGLTVLPMADALAGLVAAVPASTLVMVDANCRPGAVVDPDAYRRRMASVLVRADIVKVSADDLDYLALAPTHDEAARRILRAGTSAVLHTRGGDRVTVHTGVSSLDLDVPRVAVVDTVGAGDAFGGAFLTRWLELGRPREGLDDIDRLREAAAFAVRVASMTCQRAGADPPTRVELDAA